MTAVREAWNSSQVSCVGHSGPRTGIIGLLSQAHRQEAAAEAEPHRFHAGASMEVMAYRAGPCVPPPSLFPPRPWSCSGKGSFHLCLVHAHHPLPHPGCILVRSCTQGHSQVVDPSTPVGCRQAEAPQLCPPPHPTQDRHTCTWW